jgi:ABC-type uncharacterized transport system substrate-binding protein
MKWVGAILGLCLCASVSAFAQDQTTLPLIAMLRVNTADTVEPGTTLFRKALVAVGQVDGRNIRLENRLAEGRSERLPDVAQSLVREHPTVIVTFVRQRRGQRSRRRRQSRSWPWGMIWSKPD